MRALLDTNLFISYLLKPNRESPPAVILQKALAGAFTLLVVGPLFDELTRKVTTKPFLTKHISTADLLKLIDMMESNSEPIAVLSGPIPRVCRDPADDFLLAHALVAHADYLVSGDHDLLVLDPLGSLRIVSPAEFLTLLSGPA